jgi:RNA polymerase sigma factor (sigma-70 family)
VALVAARRTTSATRGDAVDAGRLFEVYSARIFGYCLARLGSRSDAEDAVQTTFLHAHRALQRGVVPESESAWLTAIAKNVCRSQQRTILRRGRLSSDVELDSLAGPQEVGGEDSELLFGLEEALASMPEKQRQALVLREWHGMSGPEVASEMGMSSPATHALLTRARRSLAKALTTLPRRPVLGLGEVVLLESFAI